MALYRKLFITRVANSCRSLERSTFLHFSFVFLIAHSSSLICNAQEKNVTRSHMLGYGTTNVLDTYLSAEHFNGPGLSFVATIERQRPDRHWSTLMEHEANVASVKDRADSQQELEGA